MRGKSLKPTNYARRLVFGLLRGDTGGISPGKRLRVEHESAGRVGGIFMKGSGVKTGEGSPLQCKENVGEVEGVT